MPSAMDKSSVNLGRSLSLAFDNDERYMTAGSTHTMCSMPTTHTAIGGPAAIFLGHVDFDGRTVRIDLFVSFATTKRRALTRTRDVVCLLMSTSTVMSSDWHVRGYVRVKSLKNGHRQIRIRISTNWIDHFTTSFVSLHQYLLFTTF